VALDRATLLREIGFEKSGIPASDGHQARMVPARDTTGTRATQNPFRFEDLHPLPSTKCPLRIAARLKFYASIRADFAREGAVGPTDADDTDED